MSSALFIHSNQTFLDRIKNEATHAPILATNLIQGLRAISNQDLSISGIFFNPADASYSALRFIELSLIQRPATPLYLISDDANEMNSEFKALMENNNIRGTFLGTEGYAELTKFLNLNPKQILADLKRAPAIRSQFTGYTAVPIVDFIHAKNYPFDVFFETDQKSLTLFATQNSEVDQSYLAQAAIVAKFLYVQDIAIQIIRDEVKKTQLNFMTEKGLPHLWKSAEVLFGAKSVLHELQRSGLNDHLVDQTLYMLGDIFQHVSLMALDESNARLGVFMEQAKNCDKTISSATLSILMCKALKFERNAVLEILGLASLLQDVALYNSPYGNISKSKIKELSPEAQFFYAQHPLVSADLVAQSTSIPDVTLQVIRQQHERKDRTGFPNRIGGMQLHPMAEVLSLINSFLEITESASAVVSSEIYRKLEFDVFPHYSDRIVTAFKEILDAFLESANSANQSAA